MQERTANNRLSRMSSELQEYINELVKEVVLNGKDFNSQKKWLKKYVEAEGGNYENIEKGLERYLDKVDVYSKTKDKTLKNQVSSELNTLFVSEKITNEIIAEIEHKKNNKKSSKTNIYIVVFVIIIGVISVIIYNNHQKEKQRRFLRIQEICLTDTLYLKKENIDTDIESLISDYKLHLQDINFVEKNKHNKSFSLGEEYKNDIREYNVPIDMIRNDPFLVELILKSKSIASYEEKRYWFGLYEFMKESKIEKLYDILIRERKKLNNIEISYILERIDDEKKHLTKAHQYEILYQISEFKQEVINMAWYKILLGEFDEALRIAKSYQGENTGSNYYVNEFNMALSYMLKNDYKKAYEYYMSLLKKCQYNKDIQDVLILSVDDIRFFIAHSNYNFDRHFANLILALHYYYGNGIINDEKYNYDNGFECFLLAFDEENKELEYISKEVKDIVR